MIDRPPLTEDYIAKAMQDARQFQANWDCGTSGVLAAHTFRLIKEREMQMARIAELERELAELRALHDAPELPPEYANVRLVPAEVAEQPVFDEPIPVATSMPPEQIEAAWAGIKARRDAMLARIKEDPTPAADAIVYAAVRPKLIGVTGRAGSGKSLVASMVGGMVIQLADPLYAALSVMLGLPEVLLRDRQFKERTIEWLGKSPRQMLQTLGTEWGRDSVRKDVWLQLCQRRIETLRSHGAGPIVIADVRFDNEAAMIRSSGGQVWHVRRPEADEAGVEHTSEAGIQALDGDRIIANDGTIEQLRRRVFAAMHGGYEAA
jgi:hypothetical protein